MTYSNLSPPFTLEFREMSKSDLRKYFEWFHDVLPMRLDILSAAVRNTPQFENWEADCMPSSLDQLGEWFSKQVETRPRTPSEMRQVEASLVFPIEIERWDLTNRTFSLAFDIGLYLSQVFLKNHTGLRWDQPFGSKRFVDYGQPVLVGFGKVPFNPVSMMVTQAYGLADHTRKPEALRGIYDIWSKLIRD